jgi:hypothetical protein
MSENLEYTNYNQQKAFQEDAARAYAESERLRIASQGYTPSLGGYSGTVRPSGPPRKLLSKALLITVPLGVLLYFFPKNGKDVQIPVEVHFFFAAFVAGLGSPKLRPLAIGIVILVVLFGVAVTLWTNHAVLQH